MSAAYKIPVSVLVVIHTADLQVLLLERADAPGFWQSVTGSQEAGEALEHTAIREVREETGIDLDANGNAGILTGVLTNWRQQNRYEIFARWRQRYAPGITHNTEHVFGLQMPAIAPVRIAPREHTQYRWLPYREAAALAFSPSNAAAILELPARYTNTQV